MALDRFDSVAVMRLAGAENGVTLDNHDQPSLPFGRDRVAVDRLGALRSGDLELMELLES